MVENERLSREKRGKVVVMIERRSIWYHRSMRETVDYSITFVIQWEHLLPELLILFMNKALLPINNLFHIDQITICHHKAIMKRNSIIDQSL